MHPLPLLLPSTHSPPPPTSSARVSDWPNSCTSSLATALGAFLSRRIAENPHRIPSTRMGTAGLASKLWLKCQKESLIKSPSPPPPLLHLRRHPKNPEGSWTSSRTVTCVVILLTNVYYVFKNHHTDGHRQLCGILLWILWEDSFVGFYRTRCRCE